MATKNVATLVVASVAVFVVSRVIPSTPMAVYLEARGLPVTAGNVAALRRTWGLDEPLPVQYLRWVEDMARGRWGTSIVTGQAVGPQMLSHLPLSIGIGLGGLVLACVIAYPLGLAAAVEGRGWELGSRGLAVVGQAVPSFVVALLLITVVGVRLAWISFYRLTGPAQAVAPMIVLALSTGGQLARVVAAHVRDLEDQPFVRAALARGFSRRRVLWRHGWRQVAYGLVSACVARLSGVIGGSAVLEFVFAVPGMSYYVVQSIQNRDYAVIQSYLMLLVLWMLVGHLCLGALMALLDPRTRP